MRQLDEREGSALSGAGLGFARLVPFDVGLDDVERSAVYPLADQFYGDRSGRLRDPFGHQWILSTHIKDVDREELDGHM